MTELERLAQTQRFKEGSKPDCAEMILWLLYKQNSMANDVSIADTSAAFQELHLVKPNISRLGLISENREM